MSITFAGSQRGKTGGKSSSRCWWSLRGSWEGPRDGPSALSCITAMFALLNVTYAIRRSVTSSGTTSSAISMSHVTVPMPVAGAAQSGLRKLYCPDAIREGAWTDSAENRLRLERTLKVTECSRYPGSAGAAWVSSSRFCLSLASVQPSPSPLCRAWRWCCAPGKAVFSLIRTLVLVGIYFAAENLQGFLYSRTLWELDVVPRQQGRTGAA